MKRIGIIALAVVMVLALLPAQIAAAAEYGTVKGGWLRLRTAPSYDATIINSYYTGTVVEILGTSGAWYSVKAPDNQAGYMYSDYITLGGSGGSTTITKYVTSANGYGVKLRTGPGKGYRVLAVYSVGTKVTVLQTGTIWSRIQIGTTVGYMMSEFLTSSNPGSSPSTPVGSDMATIWSSNGYGVRLRSGPSTSSSIIGLYSVGTRVSVQSRGTEWDYILVGSRLGYMMNEFLIYDNQSQTVATGITVTADSATGMQGEYVDLDVTVTGNGSLLARLFAFRYRQRGHGGDLRRRSAYPFFRNHRRRHRSYRYDDRRRRGRQSADRHLHGHRHGGPAACDRLLL